MSHYDAIPTGDHTWITPKYDPKSADGFYQMADDYYQDCYDKFAAFGDVRYVMPDQSELLNAVYGKELHATMIQSQNVYGTLPSRAYGMMGIRLVTEFATYGLKSAEYHDELSDRENGEFLGLGAMTDYDGALGPSYKLDGKEVKMPYHDIPFRFDIGMGMKIMQNKDDNTSMRDYVNKMSANFSDQIDFTLLRPVNIRQPKGEGEERSIDSIYRIISSGEEINAADNAYSKGKITPSMVTPFGGATSDLKDLRGNYEDGAHKVNNTDSVVLNLGNRALQFSDLKDLYRECQMGWDTQNNKVIYASNIAADKLSSAALVNNQLLNTITVQQSVNGIKTLSGRDLGMQCSSFQGVPIIVDPHINYDFASNRVSRTRVGDIALADLDHIWMTYITPLTMYTSNNPIVNDQLIEKNLMVMRMCTRADKFICHGKITGIADDDTAHGKFVGNPFSGAAYSSS